MEYYLTCFSEEKVAMNKINQIDILTFYFYDITTHVFIKGDRTEHLCVVKNIKQHYEYNGVPYWTLLIVENSYFKNKEACILSIGVVL